MTFCLFKIEPTGLDFLPIDRESLASTGIHLTALCHVCGNFFEESITYNRHLHDDNGTTEKCDSIIESNQILENHG